MQFGTQGDERRDLAHPAPIVFSPQAEPSSQGRDRVVRLTGRPTDEMHACMPAGRDEQPHGERGTHGSSERHA